MCSSGYLADVTSLRCLLLSFDSAPFTPHDGGAHTHPVTGSVITSIAHKCTNLAVLSLVSDCDELGNVDSDDIASVLQACRDLIALELVSFDKLSLSAITPDFDLKLVYFRDEQDEDVTDDASGAAAFLNRCPSLKTLVLGPEVPFSNIVVEAIRSSCQELENLWIWQVGVVRSQWMINDWFSALRNLRSVHIDGHRGCFGSAMESCDADMTNVSRYECHWHSNQTLDRQFSLWSRPVKDMIWKDEGNAVA